MNISLLNDIQFVNVISNMFYSISFYLYFYRKFISILYNCFIPTFASKFI